MRKVNTIFDIQKDLPINIYVGDISNKPYKISTQGLLVDIIKDVTVNKYLMEELNKNGRKLLDNKGLTILVNKQYVTIVNIQRTIIYTNNIDFSCIYLGGRELVLQSHN